MDRDFFWGYLPFQAVNYGLAIVMWSAIGFFLLSFLGQRLPAANYIRRAFEGLSRWAIVATSWITPSFVRPFFLPLCAAFWLYLARLVFFVVMWRAGLTPSLGGG